MRQCQPAPARPPDGQPRTVRALPADRATAKSSRLAAAHIAAILSSGRGLFTKLVVTASAHHRPNCSSDGNSPRPSFSAAPKASQHGHRWPPCPAHADPPAASRDARQRPVLVPGRGGGSTSGRPPISTTHPNAGRLSLRRLKERQTGKRRMDNGTLAQIVVSNAMGAPVSRSWQRYWQPRVYPLRG